MKIILQKDFSEKSYFLHSNDLMFHRYADSGFKTKWCGLWKKNRKFIEYFAFKINDTWLSDKNIVQLDYDGNIAIHTYSLDGIVAKEKIWLENNKLKVELEIENNTVEDKDLMISLEIALNFRIREENWHDRKYSVMREKDISIIESSGFYLGIKSFPEGFLIGNEYYKDHYPSNEKQRCFIPGIYEVKRRVFAKKKASIYFEFVPAISIVEIKKSLSGSVVSSFRNEIYEKEFFESNDQLLNNAFRVAVSNLRMLYYKNSLNGFIAGYPWFIQLWARDIFLSSKGILYAGMRKELKNSLIEFLNRINDRGELPHLIEFDGRNLYDGADTEVLFLIALENYVKYSGDLRFLFDIKSKLNEVINRVLSFRDDDGFILNSYKYTWMDTLDRTGKPIELESMFVRSLRSIAFLLKQFEDPSYQDYLVEYKNMESLLLNKFVSKRIDRITLDGNKEKVIRSNFIFPVYYNQVSYVEMKDVLDELEFDYGITTVSRNETVYSPDKYHEGCSWLWQNFMYSEILFRNSRFNHAYNIMEKNYSLSNRKSLVSLPECINPETNEIKDAFMQLWSSAFLLEAIDYGLLGLEFDMINRTIKLSPMLRDGMVVRRRKMIDDDDEIELLIERKQNKYKFSLKSMKGREYKVIFLPKL